MPRRNPPQRLSSYPHGRRLRVEPLEDRRMLATFVVDLLEDNTEDDGLTTLREAIALANATGEGDVIEFASNLEGGTMQLELGEMVITGDVEIVGPGETGVTLRFRDAPPPNYAPEPISRILRIDDGSYDTHAQVVLRKLDFLGGYIPEEFGGAILSREDLTIVDSSFRYNVSGSGGAIAVIAGTLHVTNTQFLHNRTLYGGLAERGGAIYPDAGDVVVRGSTFQNGRSTYGGAIMAENPTAVSTSRVEISDSTFVENYAVDAGGAVWVDSTPLFVRNSQLERNFIVDGDSDDGGGAIYASMSDVAIEQSRIVGNGLEDNDFGSPWRGIMGGGILIEGGYSGEPAVGSLIIKDSVVTHNFNSFGERPDPRFVAGGAVNAVRLTSIVITGSQISSNYGYHTGGATLQANEILISDSLFHDNEAYSFGGALALDGSFLVTNSTFTGNRVTSTSGSGTGRGGAIYTYAGSYTRDVRHSVFLHNVASGSPAYYDSSGAYVVSYSVFFGNRTLSGAREFGPFVNSAGFHHNFVEYERASRPLPDSNGNFIGGPASGPLDPMLGPLQYNGGPTPTHRPLSGSPLIDAGDPAFDPSDPDGDPNTDDAVLYDQRGEPFARVKDGVNPRDVVIDIGAVEYDPTLTPGDFNGDRLVDARDYLVWRNSLGTEVTPLAGADASGNGAVDVLDYLVWKDHFSEVYPELPEEPQLPEESELAGAGATLLAVPTGLSVDRRMPPTRRGEFVDRSRVRQAEDSDSQLLLVVDRVANQPDLQRASGADDRLVERATRTGDGEPLVTDIAARQLAFDELAG